jgi:phosphoserine aminotransferase
MPSREEITYFGAGPALLPTDVLKTAANALVDYENTGLGLAEHSHRSELATGILNTTKADLAKYLDVPDDYEILFMQGGGSGEFSATVYNMVNVWVERRKQKILKELGVEEGKIPENELVQQLQKAVDEELKIDYIVTGSWSLKASQEAARLVGAEHVNVVADARKVNDGKFGKIPEESSWKLSKNPAMVYYCDNETVDGVEFPGFPKILEPNGDDSPPISPGADQKLLAHLLWGSEESRKHRYHSCHNQEEPFAASSSYSGDNAVKKVGFAHWTNCSFIRNYCKEQQSVQHS